MALPENLSDILDPRCVELELDGKRKQDLIRELVDVLDRGGKVSDASQLAREVLEREKLASTGIGSGIAIPHALSSTVSETVMAFGLKLDGARFDAVDKQPVSIFFLLVGPVGAHAEHLRVLSKLARYLHDRTFCQALLDGQSEEDIIAALRSKEHDSP
jgi:fructose-specific phosphotransferase system IIA component